MPGPAALDDAGGMAAFANDRKGMSGPSGLKGESGPRPTESNAPVVLLVKIGFCMFTDDRRRFGLPAPY